jgi:phosphomannomutase/phosphoglucomutase
MIEILSKGSKLNELNQFIPKYYASQMVEIPCDDNTKFQVVNEVKKKAKEMDFETDQTDGVKIFSNDKDGWVLIRASNTSPVIRINSDARSEIDANSLLKFGEKLVREVI